MLSTTEHVLITQSMLLVLKCFSYNR